MSKRSELEETLSWQMRVIGIPIPEREFRFHPSRLWRFDFAWADHKLAVEVEGGTENNGRHNRAQGYEDDCEKYSEAAILGWRIIRVTSRMVKDGRGYCLVEKAFLQMGITLSEVREPFTLNLEGISC